MLLNDIPGQETPKKILLASINKDRLASTYLFYGPDGVGKWAVAIALSALINCEKPRRNESGEIIDACGECRHCRQINGYNFGEILFAVPMPPHRNEAESIEITRTYLEQKKEEPYSIISSSRQMTIPIGVAREIKRRTAIRPDQDCTRIILFYQMEKMLASSADSLLKLIEEPPPRTIIILTVGNPDNLLSTIQSRSQKIRFKGLTTTEISDYLQNRYEIGSEKSEFAARLAEGSIGKALEIHDNEEKDSLRQVSFLVFKELFFKDKPSAVALLNEMINPNNKGEVEQILKNWQIFLSDLITIKFGSSPDHIVSVDLKGELEKISARLGESENIRLMTESIKKLLINLKRNVHIRPGITSLVLDLKKYTNQSA